MVTIRDVAKASGFSPTTVSMVLSNSSRAKYIPAKTKATIRSVSKQLGYTPNVFARSLRAQRSDTIGVVVFDITDPYCTHVLRGIEDELKNSSFLYLLSDAQNDSTRFQEDLQLLLQRRIEGLILVANALSVDPMLLNAIHAPQLPTAIIGREGKTAFKSSSVTVDNELGGYLALQHLYQLGHRQIAFLRGPETIVDSVHRWRGIEKLASEAGLSIPEDLIVELSAVPATSSDGFKAIKTLLTHRRTFTAVLAFDDLTAAGAIRALTEAGRVVPRDCSVIGFDDIDAADFYNPPLTTIRQPMASMGKQGASIVLSAIKNLRAKRKAQEVHRMLEPELVIRNSTAPPATN